MSEGGEPGRTAAVLGGGLAGIAAALRLAEHGHAVTLIETRRRLGGRATSFEQRDADQTVDNCQHVLLGCCTNLVDLYERLGVDHLIEWHDRLHFIDKSGAHDVLASDRLPAPLHLMRSLWRFGTLSRSEKFAISRAMASLWRTGRAGRIALADLTFADWLHEHDQPERAIERFWSVILISALNQTPARSSAAHAMQVFQDGFLAHRKAYVMGVSSVPLVHLYDAAVEAIQRRGGQVRLGESIDTIDSDDDHVTGVRLSDGSHIEADAYISALPFDRLDKVIDHALRGADDRLSTLGRFTVSPILGIHLWFSRQVTALPHLIFVDSPLQWAFNKGVEEQTGHQYLHGVISAADDWVGQPAETIVEMALAELAKYIPEVGVGAELVRSRVIKEKRATFSPSPGVDAIRPDAAGTVGNLFLAGDWCATGWPATMEGAVRSGYNAAGAVLGQPMLIDDLKPGPLYRMFSRTKRAGKA